MTLSCTESLAVVRQGYLQLDVQHLQAAAADPRGRVAQGERRRRPKPRHDGHPHHLFTGHPHHLFLVLLLFGHPCRLFLGPGSWLVARWNRLGEAVKTRKKRGKTGKKWARYGLKGVKEGS